MERVGQGQVKQAPAIMNPQTGEVKAYAITDRRIFPESQAKAAGFICCNSISDLSNSKNMQVSGNRPFAVLPAEKVNGLPAVVRSEIPDASSGSETITLTLENGEATAQEILFGDGLGINKEVYSISDKAAGVVVGGTYGANTLTLYKQIAGGSALRLHGFHIVNTNSGNDSTGFFDSGKVELLKAMPTNNSPKRNRFDLQQLVNSNSFKPNIREKQDFRFILAGYTAMLFTIPAGEKISLTFNLRSYADGYLMNRED